MRVLVATNPGVGHLLPLVPLAQAARDAGHEVVVIGGASLAGGARDAGLAFVDAGPPDLPSLLARVPERVGLHGPRLAAMTWKHAFAGVMAREMAAAVLGLARSWRPDLVLHEDSEQGSWVAAERLGIPHLTLEATAWRGSRLRLSDEPLNRLRADLGLASDPGLAGWHRFGFLTTRPPALHDPADPMPAGTRPIRPTAPDMAGGEDAWWPAGTDGGPGARPRIVVTMGTVLPGRHETLAAVLDGLEALDVDVVATVGPGVDPAALGPRRAATRVAGYVPVGPLLADASLLVFHGGSGTMLAGLAAGVPLVILPAMADQPDNAERCRAAGVARVLPPGSQGPDEVREAADAVLRDGSYLRAARRLRDEIAGMPPPAALVPVLEELVRP